MNMYEEFCCADFAEHANRDDYENGAFVKKGNKHWSINGCCSGGCFVVDDMYFCPFCGAKIYELEELL